MASPDVTRTVASLFVWNVASFAEHWCPIDAPEPCRAVAIQDVPSLEFHAIHLPNMPRRLTRIVLSAHESPLREGIYSVWVYVSNSTNASTFAYSLSLSPTSGPHEPSLRQRRSTSDIPKGGLSGEISYGGHVSLWNKTHWHQILNCRGEFLDKVPIGFPNGDTECTPYLSAYGRTYTCLTRYSIVVDYYK